MTNWTKIDEDEHGKKYYVSDAPSYVRHYKRTDAGSIRWSVDFSAPARHVADGIAPTLQEAKAAVDDVIQHDTQRNAE